MQIFNQLVGKIIWVFLVVIMLAGGYIFLVRNLIKPPQIANNQPIPTTTPTPDTTSTSSDPTVINSATVTDDNQLEGDILPAIAQPDGVIIEVPERLEPGGILKVYTNTDEAKYPDPLNYSPTKVIETDGLEMVNLEEESNKFQKVEGYFLVPKTGEYSFVINSPKSYKDAEIGSFNAKVDGMILSSPKGVEIYLEEGYHKISLFNNYSVRGNYPSVDWAATGEEVKPLKVFREAKNETTETQNN